VKARCGTRQCFTWIRLTAAIVCLMAATPGIAAQLTLTWTDNADNESGSRIERRNSPSGGYSELATIGANIVSECRRPAPGLMAFFILSASATRP